MRICVDLSPLLVSSAGVKTYLYEWSRALLAQAGRHQMDLFPALRLPAELAHDRSALGLIGTWTRLLAVSGLNNRVCQALGFSALDTVAKGADVFHASSLTLNPPRRIQLTATLHDLTCWLMPELHQAANVRAQHAFADHVLRRARAVIAASESTRQDALRILGLDPERVTVIHHGVSPEFFEAQPEPRPPGAKPYILYVGTIEARKNIALMLDSYEALPDELRHEFDLVLAGLPGWANDSTLARLRQAAPGIRYLGYVPPARLPALTAGASVFLYPSLYEGFGLPVAQAMAAGVPVITSNVSSLPEVTGDAALLIDPRSTCELTAAINRLLTSTELRAHLATLGRRRAASLTWRHCAEQSWAFFERLAG